EAASRCVDGRSGSWSQTETTRGFVLVQDVLQLRQPLQPLTMPLGSQPAAAWDHPRHRLADALRLLAILSLRQLPGAQPQRVPPEVLVDASPAEQGHPGLELQ